jgi:hypothetical protein
VSELSHCLEIALCAVSARLRAKKEKNNGSQRQRGGTSLQARRLVIPLKKELRTAQVT